MSGMYIDLFMDQGTTFSESLSIRDRDNQKVNLANTTLTCQMRRQYNSANATANLTVTVTDAANGNVTITLAAANTANVPEGRYVYDVRANTANVITRLVEGLLQVFPSTTR